MSYKNFRLRLFQMKNLFHALLYQIFQVMIVRFRDTISQKPPCINRRVKIPLLDDGFFSFAVVRQIIILYSFLNAL